jgi:hypothetical protein
MAPAIPSVSSGKFGAAFEVQSEALLTHEKVETTITARRPMLASA